MEKVAGLIAKSISDSQIYCVKCVLEDPGVSWKRLPNKFERKSIMESAASLMEMLKFSHIETDMRKLSVSKLYSNLLAARSVNFIPSCASHTSPLS